MVEKSLERGGGGGGTNLQGLGTKLWQPTMLMYMQHRGMLPS